MAQSRQPKDDTKEKKSWVHDDEDEVRREEKVSGGFPQFFWSA